MRSHVGDVKSSVRDCLMRYVPVKVGDAVT